VTDKKTQAGLIQKVMVSVKGLHLQTRDSLKAEGRKVIEDTSILVKVLQPKDKNDMTVEITQ
jgi:hypothetical protein